MTPKQEAALREYLQESIVPLIEQVLVKKLGQAMSFAAEQLIQPKPAQQQEPVAWVETREDGSIYWGCETDTVISDDPSWLDRPVPVYFGSPASKPWVGLTQQDIDIAFDDTQEGGGFDEFARAIEAKLREKNT